MSHADGTPFAICPSSGVKGDGPLGLAGVSVLRWKPATAWNLLLSQGCCSNVSTQFDLQEEILAVMARQARRSLRSLSASSCSSLSSIDSLSSSLSGPSPAFLPPFTGFHTGSFERGPGFDAQAEPETLQDETPCILGKRRRKRNTEKEVPRLAKRQKGNPRNRRRSKRERVDANKTRQGMRHAVMSNITFSTLSRSKIISKEHKVYDVETVKSMGVVVVPWDGV